LDENLRRFLAILTQAGKLKQVVIYSESALSGYPSLQVIEIVGGAINNYTAVGANQVVMFLWSTDCISVAVAASMQLTDKL